MTSPASVEYSSDEVDLLIFLRKGIHTCNTHHVHNFFSDHYFSPSYLVFVTNLLTVEVSKTVPKVMTRSGWLHAMIEEMTDLRDNGTREIVHLPPGDVYYLGGGCKFEG